MSSSAAAGSSPSASATHPEIVGQCIELEHKFPGWGVWYAPTWPDGQPRYLAQRRDPPPPARLPGPLKPPGQLAEVIAGLEAHTTP